MPVYRTPDGRIVEERTTVTPPGAEPDRDAGGSAGAGRAEPADDRRGRASDGEVARRGTGYTDPTVVCRPAGTADRRGPADDERTRLAGAVPADTPGAAETDPVAGWLVVVDGPGLGQDLRIGAGRHDLGRDRGNRIALPFGDTRISRRTHLWINYDPMNRAFSVAPGNSTNWSL